MPAEKVCSAWLVLLIPVSSNQASFNSRRVAPTALRFSGLIAAWLVEMTMPLPPALKLASTASRTLSGVLFFNCTSIPRPTQMRVLDPATPSTARFVSW